MKRMLAVIALPVAAALLVAGFLVAAANDGGRHRGKQSVYFGFLLNTNRLAAVAIDLAAPDNAGQRALRAYVCDGLGIPDGMAIWFTGTVDAQGPNPQDFASAGAGKETLSITVLKDRGVYGTFTDATGPAHFVAYPAKDGAGIYQVTLDEALRYTGTSTDGARLDAQAAQDGTTVGTIKPAGGKKIDFTVRSLPLASPTDLAAHGLPEDYPKYKDYNQVPDTYVAVIAPSGSHWFGRSGLVQSGSPGLNIISMGEPG